MRSLVRSLPDIKVNGQWKYLYRAVDKAGDAVDLLLTAKRDKAAARRYLERAINLMVYQSRSP